MIMCLAMFGCKAETPDGGEAGASDTVVDTAVTTEASQSETTEAPESGTASMTSENDEVVSGGSTPLLYKVTDSDGSVVWLFGSIHIGREDFYPLPDYVTAAFESSDALAVEVDVVAFETDLQGQMAALQKLVYTDGTTIKDHVSEETYNSAVEILKDSGMYNVMMDYYMPTMWMSLIENSTYDKIGADAELGIDRYLIELANERDKEIREIESAEFQYGMLSGFSEELKVYLLEGAVEEYSDLDAAKDEYFNMMDLWALGDEQGFSEYLKGESEVEDPEEAILYEEFYDAMFTERNDGMTEYAENALSADEEVFICVGAAHVVGDGAMAEQLRALGYTVEIVG